MRSGDRALPERLQNGDPFGIDTLVECLMQLTVAALRSAAALGRTLDMDAALRPVLDALSGFSEVQQGVSPIHR
ncbi:hypothetical protein ABZ511_13965 [Nocardia gamkensis]|uniref:hypothetical protein n=1 Tax=Nocardia gamkensis TaxID=352869 RepID=UPI00340DCE06